MRISQFWRSGLCCWMVALAVFTLPLAAHAALGEKVDTVSTDQARLRASRRITTTAHYQVHELQVADGSQVREFVSPDGMVFGVAWSGRSLPRYDTLLGTYTKRLNEAAQSRRDHHAPLHINDPEFVFSAFGHMRFYAGRAYLPGLVPSGVALEELR